MNTQLQQLYNQPLQSTQACMIPVRFEEKTTKPKDEQLEVIELKRGDTKTKQCRICLQGDESISKLEKPCKCTGSIQYAHVHCLIEWIKRRISMNTQLKAKCEVCDSEFNYRIASERVFDCGQLKRHYQREKRGIVCFCVIYGIFLLCFIAIITLVAVGKNQQSLFIHPLLTSAGGTTLVLSILIIYSIGLIVVTILFISQYLVKEQLAIVDVMKFKEPKSLAKSHKIYFRKMSATPRVNR